MNWRRIPLLDVRHSQTFVLLGKAEGRIPEIKHAKAKKKITPSSSSAPSRSERGAGPVAADPRRAPHGARRHVG